MRIRTFGTMALILVATIVYAQKVSVDSDPSAPFASYKPQTTSTKFTFGSA